MAMDMDSEWKYLIDGLEKEKVLKTEAIKKAFRKIDRKDFVLEERKDEAYIDEALPTFENQTISQPYTVAFMLELLQPEAGDRILDIGAGSGWQTSLLAEIVGSQGKVFAVEIIPELCKFGVQNVEKYGFIKSGVVEWFCKSAGKGLFEKAPFDKIIAAASLSGEIPKEWKNQLKIGGRMVVPVRNSLVLYLKKGENDFEIKEYPGFVFVPFSN